MDSGRLISLCTWSIDGAAVTMKTPSPISFSKKERLHLSMPNILSVICKTSAHVTPSLVTAKTVAWVSLYGMDLRSKDSVHFKTVASSWQSSVANQLSSVKSKELSPIPERLMLWDLIPKTAKYTDQGAVYVHFLNQTPSAWLELTEQAIDQWNDSSTDSDFIDLTNYKRFFLYKKLLQIETQEFGLIWHQLCAIKQTQLNHVWQLQRIDPSLGIRALLGRDDLHAEWAGQALIFWECRNITPAIIHWSGQHNSSCYKHTPIQLETHGALYFISPGSRDLVKESPILDCSHAPPHYFKDAAGQWHSSSGPIHVSKIPLEMSWKVLWSTFAFKAPSLFSNTLGHFSNFLDFQHQIHRTTLVEKTLERLVDYTSSMSLDPSVIKNSIAGIGEGMAHIVEGNAKALGHLITWVTWHQHC